MPVLSSLKLVILARFNSLDSVHSVPPCFVGPVVQGALVGCSLVSYSLFKIGDSHLFKSFIPTLISDTELPQEVEAEGVGWVTLQVQ